MNDSAYIICRNTKETDAHKAAHALDKELGDCKRLAAEYEGGLPDDDLYSWIRRTTERLKSLEDMLKPWRGIMAEQARIESIRKDG